MLRTKSDVVEDVKGAAGHDQRAHVLHHWALEHVRRLLRVVDVERAGQHTAGSGDQQRHVDALIPACASNQLMPRSESSDANNAMRV